jgi:hypothetical protein
MPVNIITGGTLTVELDVGFSNGFVLDDTQQGVLEIPSTFSTASISSLR